MIQLLFDRERDNLASQYFKQTYPHIFDFICQFKSGCYTDLANDLQKLESTIMIEGVCVRFKQQYPDVPLSDDPRLPVCARVVRAGSA